MWIGEREFLMYSSAHSTSPLEEEAEEGSVLLRAGDEC